MSSGFCRSLAGGVGCCLVDDQPRVSVGPVGRVQLQGGIGVGQAGRLVGREHGHAVRPRRHTSDRATDARPEIEHDMVVGGAGSAEFIQQLLQDSRR